MAAQVGRTVARYLKIFCDDSGGTLREFPVDSVNGVGLDYPAVDATAFQDAVRGVLLDTPDCKITVTGPIDSTAVAAASASGAAPSLSGSHTVLSGIVGANTPLAFGIASGVRQYYTTGEPCFGLNYGATSGFLCSKYSPDFGSGKYSAEFVVFAGSVAPSWLNAIPTS